jgi:hypothetical protein
MKVSLMFLLTPRFSSNFSHQLCCDSDIMKSELLALTDRYGDVNDH